MICNLNENQQQYAKSSVEDSKLLGIPGSGKTTTIVVKILNHFSDKTFTTKNDFMVCTFSRKACRDFIQKGSNLNKNKNTFTKNNIRTFHSIAGTIIQKLLGKQCSSLQIAIISAINIIKNKTKKELLQIKCFKTLKIIFVDEAQDMSNIQYEFMTMLKDKLCIKLSLIGDPDQNIYQFQNGSDKYLMEYPGTEYCLTINNRSSPEIVNFLNYFRPWKMKLPPMISSRLSTKIKPMVFSGTQDEICLKILNELKKTKISREKIAIIGPVKKSDKKSDNIYLKFGLQKITNMFSKNKIKFIKHYNDIANDNEVGDIELPLQKDHVNIFTIHGSKGLEFDKIIIVNFHFKTFGKIPSVDEYNQFKYMWFVALSRAKTELLICCDNDKICWNELLNCPENLYQTSGDELILKEPKFSTETPCHLSISNIVNDKKIFDEEILLKFYKDINFSENKEILYKINNIQNDFIYKNTTLVTNFVKAIFEYWYCLFHSTPMIFINEIKNFLSNVIFISKKYCYAYHNFCTKCNIDIMGTTTLQNLIDNKDKFNREEKKLLEYIKNKINHNKKNKPFSIAIKNDDIFMNSSTILKICDNVFCYTNDEELYWNILKLCLFKYQYTYEAKYMWKNRNSYKQLIDILMDNIKTFKNLAIFIKNGYNFRINCHHPNLKTIGKIDMITENGHFVMIKFCENVEITDKVKLFLQYHSHSIKWDAPKIIEIWNLKKGIRHILQFSPQITNIATSMKVAYLCKVKLYNMIFVYDLETTGLDKKTCEILERYIHEITHDETFSNGVIKVKFIPHEIIKLTGITQKESNKGQEFIEFKNEMKHVVDICFNPIFIAHNGNSFDHIIMKIQGLLTNNCKYLDSRTIIRQLSKNKIGNETLSETYKIIMGYKFKGSAHRAKADVIMLLDIFKKMNLQIESFIKMI